MARKRVRFTIDAPVILFFVLAGILIFALDKKFNLIGNYFTCHLLKPSDEALPKFNMKDALDYARLICHPFGNKELSVLLLNSVFIMFLGPLIEERTGSPILILTILLASLVSGVLAVLTNTEGTAGAGCIIFMLLALSALGTMAQGQFKLSWIAAFVLYLVYRIYTQNESDVMHVQNIIEALPKSIPVFIDLAGGICGSLVGFFITPHKSRGRPFGGSSFAVNDDDTTLPAERLSPPAKKAKKKKPSAPAEEAEVIGSIEF